VAACVKEFQTSARTLIGDSAYDEIALSAAKLDEVEDMSGDGLED